MPVLSRFTGDDSCRARHTKLLAAGGAGAWLLIGLPIAKGFTSLSAPSSAVAQPPGLRGALKQPGAARASRGASGAAPGVACVALAVAVGAPWMRCGHGRRGRVAARATAVSTEVDTEC
eukprot:CAMPEP_0179084674 /NCGR_PEP_ID=MMETSP0796-20121207/38305_1 /TAXON_ID=73915 /ORGANISM="Pyrodinium bahamense, Strain pbaha01" /LENGTH=118 /DNA_ID=CAMNT_0020782099 /DNA_START=71 /DNA_END=424 /DNA_ORIENTATION=+